LQLTTDITEQKRGERLLAEKATELERMNVRFDAALNNMSSDWFSLRQDQNRQGFHVRLRQPPPKERPAAGNVVDLMEALRRSVDGAAPAKAAKPAKKPNKAAAGQKEMPMSIEGKKTAREAATKKPSVGPHRKSA
jgi:hypothetical protein